MRSHALGSGMPAAPIKRAVAGGNAWFEVGMARAVTGMLHSSPSGGNVEVSDDYHVSWILGSPGLLATQAANSCHMIGL